MLKISMWSTLDWEAQVLGNLLGPTYNFLAEALHLGNVHQMTASTNSD